MSLIDAINRRKSVRNYDGRLLSREDVSRIEAALPTYISGGGRIVFLQGAESGKIGTYGIFHHVPAWFIVIAPEGDAAVMSAAKAMEDIVLQCTVAGLATCWIGGTFRASTIARRVELASGERIVAIVAAGYAAERENLLSWVASKIARSRQRKPFESLFEAQGGDFGPFAPALEAVRQAPSAVNAQPWRAKVSAEGVVFYCATDNKYSMLDMGIAMSHFETACRELGIHGTLTLTLDAGNGIFCGTEMRQIFCFRKTGE